MKVCKKHDIEFSTIKCPACKKLTRQRCKENKDNGTTKKIHKPYIDIITNVKHKYCNTHEAYHPIDEFYDKGGKCKAGIHIITVAKYQQNKEFILAKNKVERQQIKEDPYKLEEYRKKQRKYDAAEKAKMTPEKKEKRREYDRKWSKMKRKSDPIYVLKDNISRSINKALASNNSSKNGKSCSNYLPYTIEELKTYVESQFEPWMNWSNRGVYKVNEWDDNDPSTWKWNLDHIEPHSKFKYETMDCDEFRKCWALSNLRPYSAKQNIIDGNRRRLEEGKKQ